MKKLLVALVAGAFATAGLAQSAAPPADAKAATTKSKQDQVIGTTTDKGYTQRAADQAAQAQGSGASAKEARRAASRANVQSTTADKGYTQRAADESAKAAEAKKKEQDKVAK